MNKGIIVGEIRGVRGHSWFGLAGRFVIELLLHFGSLGWSLQTILQAPSLFDEPISEQIQQEAVT